MSFLILLFTHLLADYPLQPSFLATEKAGKNDKLFILLLSHAGIWTGCIALAGYLIGLNIDYLDITLLFIVHTIADYLKATGKLFHKNLDPLNEGLLIDQLIHIGQILLLLGMN